MLLILSDDIILILYYICISEGNIYPMILNVLISNNSKVLPSLAINKFIISNITNTFITTKSENYNIGKL